MVLSSTGACHLSVFWKFWWTKLWGRVARGYHLWDQWNHQRGKAPLEVLLFYSPWLPGDFENNSGLAQEHFFVNTGFKYLPFIYKHWSKRDKDPWKPYSLTPVGLIWDSWLEPGSMACLNGCEERENDQHWLWEITREFWKCWVWEGLMEELCRG